MDITSRLLWVAMKIVQYHQLETPELNDLEPLPLNVDHDDTELWNEFIDWINVMGGM